MQNITPEVQSAINHVKQFHPTLAIVAFSIEGTWQYFDEDFNSFVFDDKINVSILEAAVDSVSERPAIFQIGNE